MGQLTDTIACFCRLSFFVAVNGGVCLTDTQRMELMKCVTTARYIVQNEPENYEAHEDLFQYIRKLEEVNEEMAHKLNKEVMRSCLRGLRGNHASDFWETYKHTLLFESKRDLDCYLIYLEIDRPPSEKFYAPRREKLLPIVRALQALEDGDLDELFLSQPPRTGKTTLIMMFATWVIGKHHEMSNLYSAFSDIITKAFYNGVLEIINDPYTYKWSDVFPDTIIASTNAQDETLNLVRKKRYPTLTCRSIMSTLNGACDCSGYLISDDLIGGIEEALNPDRLVATWGKVDNNLLTRAKEGAKILWIGTRWSNIDPIGVRIDLLQNDDNFRSRRYQIVNIPALDENDESNFDYRYGVGFSTQMYHMKRASFERNNDMASWLAQYMGCPIERNGSVFTPNDFRYYNGVLPEQTADRVFMAIDPAFGGGDFLAAPIMYQYDEDLYLHDVVYSNADKKTTIPMIVKAVKEHGVQAIQIECTKATEPFKDELNEALKKEGLRVNMIGKSAPTNKSKEQRIFDKAPEIREYVILRDAHRSKEYEGYVNNVFSFTINGRNKHDDAPDSLAMAVDMAFHKTVKAHAFKRPF